MTQWLPNEKSVLDRLRYYMLIETAKYYKFLYYVMHETAISDQEYDKIETDIKELEAKHPNMLREDSPTQSVDIAPITKWRVRVDPSPESIREAQAKARKRPRKCSE